MSGNLPCDLSVIPIPGHNEGKDRTVLPKGPMELKLQLWNFVPVLTERIIQVSLFQKNVSLACTTPKISNVNKAVIQIHSICATGGFHTASYDRDMDGSLVKTRRLVQRMTDQG